MMIVRHHIELLACKLNSYLIPSPTSSLIFATVEKGDENGAKSGYGGLALAPSRGHPNPTSVDSQ